MLRVSTNYRERSSAQPFAVLPQHLLALPLYPCRTRARDPPRLRELEQAFGGVQRPRRAAGAYHDLEQRVAVLSGELAEARSERLAQLAEKERLADRLQGLLETLPGGVVVLDGGTSTSTTRAQRELLGGEPLGEPWRAARGVLRARARADGEWLSRRAPRARGVRAPQDAAASSCSPT